jgi:hypothetical protein
MSVFDSHFPFSIKMLPVNLFRNSKFTSHTCINIRFMHNTHNATGNVASSPYRTNETANMYSFLQIIKIKFLVMFYLWWRKPKAKLCSTHIMRLRSTQNRYCFCRITAIYWTQISYSKTARREIPFNYILDHQNDDGNYVYTGLHEEAQNKTSLKICFVS